MLKKSFKGATLTEYGLILGAVVIVSIGALMLMGGSLSNLLGGTVASAVGGGGSASGVIGLLAPVSGSPAGPGSVRQGTINPETGLPVATNTGLTTGSTNTTSVEGLLSKNEQSLQLGASMQSLAASDPANAPILNQMSNLLYMMGGVQGGYLESSNNQVDDLRLDSSNNYDAKTASYDLQQFQGQLTSLMQQLPPDSPSYAEARALVSDATQITGYFLGDKTYSPPKYEYSSYAENANLSEIKSTAQELLSDNGGQAESGAEATFVDATRMEGTAQTP